MNVAIGDTVEWRGGWGRDPARRAKVVALTITAARREKYGRDVETAPWAIVAENRVVFTLEKADDDDGQPFSHWAYGEQVTIPEEWYNCANCNICIEPDEEPDGLCITCRTRAHPCGCGHCIWCERSAELPQLN
tara:strand:+ start:144 stop:545 length:402 start_codon:yes stop_codon:yes gene_type:complete